jgi:hypothetical protein
VDGVSLSAVEERIKCEIADAYWEIQGKPGYPDLSRWAAGIVLTLAVDSNGSIAPSTSLTGPFGAISPLEIGVGFTSAAKRTALLNIYAAFREAAKHQCPVGASPLERELGLGKWIVRAFRSQYEVDRHAADLQTGLRAATFDKDKSIGYSLEFALTLSATATPNFLISGGTAKTVFGGELKSTHSMDIAMVEMAETDFVKRFAWITVPTSKPSNQKGMRARSSQTKRVPVLVDGRVGLETKVKIDTVLQQLNYKLLQQQLRR